jgi:hypothetical protein
MAWNAPKTNWAGADGVAFSDMNRIEENERMLRESITIFEVAGGTATTITLINVDLTAYASKTFIAAGNNNGSPTTINGKALYKPGTTNAPVLVAGKAYTVWYNGTNFFIKASATGTAVAGNVLADKTFSNDNDTDIVGTMPNRTAAGGGIAAPDTLQDGLGKLFFRVPDGYYDGGGDSYVYTVDPDFVPANFLANKNVFGLQGGIPVQGSEEYPAWKRGVAWEAINASPQQRLHLMIPKGAYIYDLSTDGSYPAGAGNMGIFIDDPDYYPSNILETANIFGLQGAIPVKAGPSNVIAADKYATEGVLRLKPPVAYYSPVGSASSPNDIGGWLVISEPNLMSSKIVNTANMFGIQGTAQEGRKFQTGEAWSGSGQIAFTMASNGSASSRYYVTVNGLTFTPHVIIVYEYDEANSNYTVYNRHINGTMALINVNAYPNGSTPDTQTYLTTGNAYVNGSGFQLPAPRPDKHYGWIAYD